MGVVMAYGLRFGLRPIPVECRRLLPLRLFTPDERPAYHLIGVAFDEDDASAMLEAHRPEPDEVFRTHVTNGAIGIYLRANVSPTLYQ